MADTAGRQGALVSFIEQFDRNSSPQAAAATGSNTVIEQLAATMTTQYDKMSASIAKLKLALPTTTTPTSRVTHSPLASEYEIN